MSTTDRVGEFIKKAMAAVGDKLPKDVKENVEKVSEQREKVLDFAEKVIRMSSELIGLPDEKVEQLIEAAQAARGPADVIALLSFQVAQVTRHLAECNCNTALVGMAMGESQMALGAQLCCGPHYRPGEFRHHVKQMLHAHSEKRHEAMQILEQAVIAQRIDDRVLGQVSDMVTNRDAFKGHDESEPGGTADASMGSTDPTRGRYL